jgi:hypothetical protein
VNRSIAGSLYYFDRIVSVMACADQHQVCNPNDPDGRCTPLTLSGNTTIADGEKIGFSDRQSNISFIFQSLLLDSEMAMSVSGRGASALVAQRSVVDTVNVQLPANQWTAEVSNWFSIALARLQHSLLEYATGPSVGATFGRGQRLNGTAMERLYANTCSLQKMRQFGFSQGHITFSVLGIAVIISVGGLLIILGLGLEVFIAKLHKRSDGSQRWDGPQRWESWIKQDKLAVWKKSRTNELELRKSAEIRLLSVGMRT